MAAQIIPFPPVRRRYFVVKQANRMASLSRDAAERHLNAQLRIQREAYERKGVNPDIIEQEIRALESAIRSALWAAVLTPGGAA